MILKSISKIDYIHPFIWQFICYALSIASFCLILSNRLPSFLRPLTIALRIEFGLLIPIVTLIMYLAFLAPKRIGELLALILTVSLFAMPLAGLWAYAHTQTSVISGLIQLNDAKAYYIDALRLTNGENFSFFSSRRPLFPGFLSILLVLTNYNLMTSLAILSAITAVSCYLVAREVQRTHSTETAVFLLMMIFLYYRLHSGIAMSENFGIAIGSLGFAILWRGAGNKNLQLIWLGIFSTTIALNARAGAFFVLIFLIIWVGWIFSENKSIPWKSIGIATSAIILGFASNLLLGRIIGQPNGIPFANFSYTLYSLAEGGKSWAYIGETHPEVLLIPEPERTKKIFQLAFELMRAKPFQTIQGAIFFWKALFTNTLYNIFSFVSKENWVINPFIKWFLYSLSIIGIFTWWQDKKSPYMKLMVLCVLGIFLSIPLAPPTDSFRMRPYAASIAMISILPATGFGYLSKKILNLLRKEPTIISFNATNIMPTYTILLLATTIVAPLFIKYIATEPLITPKYCASATDDYIVISFSKGTYINLRKNKDTFVDWAPNYHIYLFQKNTHSIENENLINWLETIPTSQTLFVALDVLTKKGFFITIPMELAPEKSGYFQICGDIENDPTIKNYSIFYGQETIPFISH